MLSLIVPVLNEEDAIPSFLGTVGKVLDEAVEPYEVIFVNDGSTDATSDIIEKHIVAGAPVRLIELSRNFGKEAALTAGLEFARGDAVVPMDVDLQDPPELLIAMLAQWRNGYQVVLARRRSRDTDSWLKRTTATAFYGLLRDITDIDIPPHCGDYRLMDRQVVDALLAFEERSRFMKGLMASAGFRTTVVEYDRPERCAGQTKFNFWRLWNFAIDGIASFSTWPLRVWTYIGAMVALCAFLFGGWIIAKTLLWGVVTPGYATTMVTILFLGGLQLIGIGVLGEYIGRIFAETKRRPIFIVSRQLGFPNDATG